MSDYKPIPVAAAREIAERYAKSEVVILACDPVHETMHTTTYGATPEGKLSAALAGQRCTQLLVGSLGNVTHYEDFRTVDAAKRAFDIERLSRACRAADHALASLLAVREGITDSAIENVRGAIAEALEGVTP